MDYICLMTAELMIAAVATAAVADVFGCCFSIMEEETEEIEEVEEVEVLLLLEVKVVKRGATTCDDNY